MDTLKLQEENGTFLTQVTAMFLDPSSRVVDIK